MFNNKHKITIRTILVVAILSLTLMGLTGTASAQTYDTAPDCSTVSYNGSGTSSDPYKISNPYELQCIGNESTSTYSSQNYILTKDINLSETKNWNNGNGLNAIPNEFANNFNGKFNGNNKTISNLYTDKSLFKLKGTNLKNLNIVNAHINTSKDSAGILTDEARDTVHIKNVDVEGKIENQSSTYYSANIGSVVGQTDHDGRLYIDNVTADVNISTPKRSRVGGIIGWKKAGDIYINNSSFNGSIVGNESVGGIIGHTTNEDQYDIAQLNNVYVNAQIEGNNRTGGIGGFYQGDLTNAYATGNIIGNELTGGIYGINGLNSTTNNYGTVANGYYDSSMDVSSGSGHTVQTTNDITALTPSEMKGSEAETNMNFDYSGIWDYVDSNNGYSGDGFPILDGYKEFTQLQYQDLSGISDLTFDITDQSGSAVNVSLEIIDDTNTVVVDQYTNNVQTVTNSLTEGTYTYQIAHKNSNFQNITGSIFLTQDSTETLKVTEKYDLKLDITNETGSTVNVSYEITNEDTNTVVVDQYTNNVQNNTHSLQKSNYSYTIAYEDPEFRNRSGSVYLTTDTTESHSLLYKTFSITLDVQDGGNTINTTYEVQNTNKEGYTTDTGTTIDLEYGDYTILIANETVEDKSLSYKYDDKSLTITADSNRTETISTDISTYDLQINTTTDGDSKQANTTYEILQSGSTVKSGYTQGQITHTLDYGDYKIQIGGEKYINQTDNITLNSATVKEYNVNVIGSQTAVITDNADNQQVGFISQILNTLAFIGPVFTGAGVVLAGFGLAYGLFRSRVRP